MRARKIPAGNIGYAQEWNALHNDASMASWLLPHQQLGAITLPNNPADGDTVTVTINGTGVVIRIKNTIAAANDVLRGGSATATAGNIWAFLLNPGLTNSNQIAASVANQVLIQYVQWAYNSATTITPASLNRTIYSPLTSFTASTTTGGNAYTAATLKLYIEPGTYYIGTTRVLFLGGSSPAFTAPVTNPRIDILTIDSSGTLAITQGSENVSPVPPAYPTNKTVICEVYNVVGETALYDNANQQSGQGYILNDVRPGGTPVYISSTSQVASGLFLLDPGSPAQGDVYYYNGSQLQRLPAGTNLQFLQTQGAGANPQWANFSGLAELASTTLGSNANTISCSSFAARKYLRIVLLSQGFNVADSIKTTFNSDSAGNYAARVSVNGGAQVTATSSAGFDVGITSANPMMRVIDIINFSAIRKTFTAHDSESAAKTTASQYMVGAGTWDNTAAQITTVTMIGSGGNNFLSGTVLKVYGSPD